jgi:stage V sporulation protein SpoVS
MNAYSSFSTPAGGVLPTSGRPEFGQASASAMSMKWSALHDAVGVAGMLAGIAAEPMRAEVRNFPAVMRDAGGWRRQRAEDGIADLAAIMEPGLAALLAVNARGINPAVAALALWQEFHAARAALLALTPPPEANTLRRFT